MASKRKWKCKDCNVCTSELREHYFLHTDLWLSIFPSKIGMLCIGCVESRLGRTLTAEDFPDVCINNPQHNEMSDRLRSRLSRT